MKILILGCGSIGKKHLKNLFHLGCQNVTVFDPDEATLRCVAKNFPQIETIGNYDTLLKRTFDVVFVCSPPSLHIQQAKDFADRKSHLFIEKPLGNSLQGVADLIQTVKKNKLITLVGCNMRFHPAVSCLNRILNKKVLGNVYHFRLEAAAFLPDWRPGTDYRNNYGAHRNMGGGIILDGIHEIDYALWLFGDAEDVNCSAGKLSQLEIDVEDVAEILLKTKYGAIGSIYLSYINQPYRRGYEVSGEKGSVRWRAEDQYVEIFTRDEPKWKIAKDFKNYDVNDSFVEMICYFFDCIDKGNNTFCNVESGEKALAVALKARQIADQQELAFE